MVSVTPAVKIIRCDQTDQRIRGALLIDGEIFCWTLEPPWRENKPNVSCIPLGRYTAVREYSPKFKCELFEFKHVIDRTEIKFHKGSVPKDTDGCPLIGLEPWGANGVRRSGEALVKFMRYLDGIDKITVEIVEV